MTAAQPPALFLPLRRRIYTSCPKWHHLPRIKSQVLSLVFSLKLSKITEFGSKTKSGSATCPIVGRILTHNMNYKITKTKRFTRVAWAVESALEFRRILVCILQSRNLAQSCPLFQRSLPPEDEKPRENAHRQEIKSELQSNSALSRNLYSGWSHSTCCLRDAS